jgi:hypothetical protein
VSASVLAATLDFTSCIQARTQIPYVVSSPITTLPASHALSLSLSLSLTHTHTHCLFSFFSSLFQLFSFCLPPAAFPKLVVSDRKRPSRYDRKRPLEIDIFVYTEVSGAIIAATRWRRTWTPVRASDAHGLPVCTVPSGLWFPSRARATSFSLAPVPRRRDARRTQ